MKTDRKRLNKSNDRRKRIKILLGFDAQFAGKVKRVVEVPNNITHKEIIELFTKVMNIQYNEDCYYEIQGERE